MPGHLDPLGSDNVLTIFVSLVTGAPIPGQSRVSICAKSPLSGAIDDSQGGGFWPAHFKMTGFDGMVITEKVEKPVYLWLHDGVAELRDATRLWGHITGDVEREIQKELGDENIDVSQIGPAGEKLVRFANIINMRNRANGRTGMGAVMGSKNLKGIAVRGKQKLTFHDPAKIKDLARWGAEHFKESDVYGLGIFGTANVLEVQQGLGGLPTRNWTSGDFEGHEAINGVALHETILKERDTCFVCVIRCKRVVEITDGDYKVDPQYGGPEYETLAALGSCCGVINLAATSKANEICNKYGMDTISCGATIAWAMDCYEHGIINSKDTCGIQLKFGNAAAMVKMVELIAKREGFGNVLAEGSARAAAKFGLAAEDLLVTVKKQEMPFYMPEAKRSLALVYAINPYGADHQSHEHDTLCTPEAGYAGRMSEIGLLEPQPLRDLGPQKIRYSMYTQWVYSACNSFSICQFVYGPAWHLYSTGQFVELIRAATGWNFSLFELMKIGERLVNMQRAFNVREGFTSTDDTLPQKLFRPLIGGPTDGVAIPQEQFTTALQTYYQMAGWDQNGCPTHAKLEELGIGWVSELIESE